MFRPIVIGILLLFSLSVHAQQSRLALVIGNADYRGDSLKNPVNDARAVASTLRLLGFEVIQLENASLRELIASLQEFSIRARRNEVRLVYYAGHGVQVKGRNFLIPIDAEIADEDDVPRKSADVNDLLDRLGDLKSGMNVVILDACRNNPFNNTPTLNAEGRRIRTRGLFEGQGLAKVSAPNGTLIAYSTSPGTVAIDGARQANSVYAKHLLANIVAPGVPIEQVFKRVRIAVAQETQNLQIPWETSSLMGDFCFRRGSGDQCGN